MPPATPTPDTSADASPNALPRVAIVGRPNVGKSTLLNRILGNREAIVDDQPGVTRDRSYHTVQWQNRAFTLIDTGGMIPNPEQEEQFAAYINDQVDLALSEADLVIFLTDGISGLTPMDREVAQRVRASGKPVLLVVNKIDIASQSSNTAEFYELGLGEPLPVSAMHGSVGVGDMLDQVLAAIDEADLPESSTDTIKLAVVGRPNVGKSSIVNGLLGHTRTIVSEIAGTTRDAIQVPFEWEDQSFMLIDTAGIRRKGKVGYGVELFSVDRSLKAMQAADVAVIVVDVSENLTSQSKSFITDQDKKIIEAALTAGRALILVVNKWDLIEEKNPNSAAEFKADLFRQIPYAQYIPVLFTSASTGQRLTKILDTAKTVYENWRRRIKTNLVNTVILDAVTMHEPPSVKNKRLKVLYATQVDSAPPVFVLFVNDATLLKDSYRRYLEKKIREAFEFTGSPVIIAAKNRRDD
ncbi:MAG: ribosome biogenesis GTPase Der [Candidatus Melainabacteria bacterium]